MQKAEVNKFEEQIKVLKEKVWAYNIQCLSLETSRIKEEKKRKETLSDLQRQIEEEQKKRLDIENQINETQALLEECKTIKENPEESEDQNNESTLEDLRSKNIYLTDEVINSNSDSKSRRNVLSFG
jgi:hypothetical protein